ncbi:Major facilitator superfamily domain general substrate transporter [Penicillium canariense]|uniref:Major facilitator superfamily domain general substrate transporter n=1 Tax=Penicillium canariense TaxID=189055 RepID=A0A9W9IG23_9EURO|nr:Major facilitator superfamily domain general substrate transporter [Penicillium canariense]KAJ5175707.1 Major facilitator superfamily domain general substrate transporter [Penicillium canariense]
MAKIDDPAEQTPLLARQLPCPLPATKSESYPFRFVVPYALVLVAAEIGSSLVNVSMSQILEGILCQQYHGVNDPIGNPLCKSKEVQLELSILQGWELAFGLIPGLLTGVLYGIIADAYSRRVVLSLAFFGLALSLAFDMLVCSIRKVIE